MMIPWHFLCFFESLFDLVPVHNTPNILEVLSLVIVIVRVPRMLPHVDIEEWNQLLVWQQVLIFWHSHLKIPWHFAVSKPYPTGSIDGWTLCCGIVYKVVERSIGLFDQDSQVRFMRGQHTPTIFNWSQWFPEESVVVVASTEKSKFFRIRGYSFKILLIDSFLNQFNSFVVFHNIVVMVFIIV